ncbi:MAG: bacterio-opsin activator domain-containing protein [Halorubrum sp.]
MPPQNKTRTDGRVTYVEFSLSDPTYPFVAVSTLDGGETELRELIPRGNGVYAEFFSISGVDPETVLRRAAEHPSVDASLVERVGNEGLFEFVAEDGCPAVTLGESGALPRTVESRNGSGTIGAEIPSSEDAAAIVDRFLDADAELTVKRERLYETPIFGQRYLQAALEARLTDRQREILESAHAAGYYDWPREVTAEELAERFDISPATFHQHLRAAERKLLALSLERE